MRSPTYHLFRLLDRTDHRGHHTARARFHRPHDGGVVRGRHSRQRVQPGSPASHEQQLELMMRNVGVFLVDKYAVDVTDQTGDFDQFRTGERTEEHHAHDLAVRQSLFDGWFHREVVVNGLLRFGYVVTQREIAMIPARQATAVAAEVPPEYYHTIRPHRSLAHDSRVSWPVEPPFGSTTLLMSV
jgi:hypothetical protein